MFQKVSFQMLKSLAIITLGNLVFALTVNLFLLPNHMGEGGVTGISLITKYTLGIDVDITYFTINAFLLLIGFRFLDKSTIGYTIYSLVIFTLFVRLTSNVSYVFHDPILTPLVAGVLVGGSIGVILLAGGSTAGTDIIALIMNKFLGIPTSVAFFIIDLCIILPGILVIGFEKSVYTLIMLVISTKAIDYILEGLNPKKSVMIISKDYDAIAQKISDDLERGITILKGKGYYTQEEKDIIYVIVDRRQVMTVQKMALAIDPRAFITIANVHSVAGEGFTYQLSNSDVVEMKK